MAKHDAKADSIKRAITMDVSRWAPVHRHPNFCMAGIPQRTVTATCRPSGAGFFMATAWGFAVRACASAQHPFRRAVRAGGRSRVRYPRCLSQLGVTDLPIDEEPYHGR